MGGVCQHSPNWHVGAVNPVLWPRRAALARLAAAPAAGAPANSACFLTDSGRSPRYSTCAARWKAAAQSWLTRVTCRLVGIFYFCMACVRAGNGSESSASTEALLSNSVFLVDLISCGHMCLSICPVARCLLLFGFLLSMETKAFVFMV